MKIVRTTAMVLFGIGCFLLMVSCAERGRAMYGYYQNHPDMKERLLRLRSIYIADIQGAPKAEDVELMRESLIDELGRKGRGRFALVEDAAAADAVLDMDMKEELGPVSTAEPLPFEIEAQPPPPETVFARMKLVDPKSGRVIYKTDTKESPDFAVNTIEKAAYTVVKNLMREIDLARASLSP
ncbi:MAG: hypothetical protein NTZ78_01645 [Candidatus Aureabacteria bacterium]|nr:hypothetical protein [Candidatus Auribacterota bacterium]